MICLRLLCTEESKEFQKLSLTHVPLRPQVPKKKVDNGGKPLEQKPAVDFLYHDITKCFAPNTYSACSAYYNSLPKPEWMRHEIPGQLEPETYSPSNPDWVRKLDFELPNTYEEYVALKSSQVPIKKNPCNQWILKKVSDVQFCSLCESEVELQIMFGSRFMLSTNDARFVGRYEEFVWQWRNWMVHRMAISVDRIHQQYQKENVVDFDFNVVGLVVATMIDGGGSDGEGNNWSRNQLQLVETRTQEFFQGSINRRGSLSYSGVLLIIGKWCTEPATVKDIHEINSKLDLSSPNNLGLKLIFSLINAYLMDLDSMVTREEIRRAVWSCGDDKSPGPDGFSFEFFRKYWNFIGPDFCGAVEHFFNKGTFTRGCNSSFIALIPKISDAKYVSDYRPISLIGCVYKVVTKILAIRLANIISDIISDTQSAFLTKRNILDGPFILNELLSWCKKYNKQAMFFKVDFAKAYDCVRWDYLLDVMKSFGFGPNWCRWIQGTLSSAKASILVNGSPTAEFSFYRGLKQGDPLSPFLFILIMESLHLSMVRASSNGMFRGLCLNGSLSVSHLFYADDAMFIGEWSQANLDNMSKCFNVSNYLGVMVGDSMNRRAAWVEVINKLRARLSNWKVKTLSIGGRYTLDGSIRGKFFNGADPEERKIVWVAWQKVLASKSQGGLGVSSFFALNRALLLKWYWRFLTKDGSLWSQVIQAIHGDNFNCSVENCLPTRFNLSRKGVMLDSILCPLCDHAVETTQHVLFQCPIVRSVFHRICNWWELEGQDLESFSEWQSWFLSIRMLLYKNLLDECCHDVLIPDKTPDDYSAIHCTYSPLNPECSKIGYKDSASSTC
ncbi:RNA-directed DNA polymerase, eukaryota [Tanacetum coccineum]